MCPEITTMKGNYQKDTVKAPGCTQKWPKSKKRTFPRTNIGEKRRRILPWTSRKPQTNPERIDGKATRKHLVVTLPTVAMAPRNTTQYLMDIVYSERLDVSLDDCESSDYTSQQNPEPIDGGVFSSSDSDFDRSMDFQQRDFENIFFRSEIIAQTPTQGGGTLRHSCVMTCTPRLQNGLQSRGQQVNPLKPLCTRCKSVSSHLLSLCKRMKTCMHCSANGCICV
ncbi:hypothetical protein DNTS_025348 [Danionella cerebrum]|uniref:Uncharacterized protein n=1 Tax=Danionella cerebrum TaxID=2873325 RepID=A0A553NME0_9TELE|nr:hypothetical protein DNTS_025348 [Danionella translucida]